MRRPSLFALALLLGMVGCAATEIEVRRGSTARVIDGHRIVGRYVSDRAYEHYLRAQLALDAGRPDDAVVELAQAIGSDGASPYLRTRLGEELLGLGRFREARDALEAALRFDPMHAEAYVALGRLAARTGDAARAEASLRRALELDRGCESAYVALAQLYRERGDGARALAVYQAMAARVPGSTVAREELARAAARRGDLRTAELELRAGLRLKGSGAGLRVELGRVLLAAGRTSDAVVELKQAFARSGRDMRLAELLVQALIAAGSPEEADAVLDSLAGSAVRERRLAVGWLLLQRGRHEAALALLAEPVVEPGARLLRGSALAAAHRTAEAITELSRIAVPAVEYVPAQLRLARTLSEAGRVTEAIRTLEEARAIIAGDRTGGDLLTCLLAEMHERLGDRERGRRLLEDALRGQPGSDAIAYTLGGVLDRGGDAERAIEVVRTILARNPDHAEAMNFIGFSWTDRGIHLPEALRLLEQARALRPASGEIADSLGWLYLKAERLDDAVRLLELAARLLPAACDVAAHLGDAYLRREDRASALAAYRRALAGNPEPRVRQAVEEKLLHLEQGRVGAR